MTCPACENGKCVRSKECHYPYRHNAAPVHGDALTDYLISEANMLAAEAAKGET